MWASWPSSPPSPCSLKRWRRRPEAGQWWIWYVILAVGVLSSLGDQTPFAHLMYLIPGVRSERLLNRNLLLVDMTLAVLLAWWVHLTLQDRTDRDGTTAESGSVRDRWRAGGSVRGRGHLHPLRLQRRGGRCSSGWRDRSSVDCSRSSTPWAPAPASGWPVW